MPYADNTPRAGHLKFSPRPPGRAVTGGFTLHVTEAERAGLRDRLARTRLPDQAPGEPWAYGTDVGYLSDLVNDWRTRFGWRAEEAALNSFPQQRAAVGDIDLHFLHVPGVGPAPKPLPLLHGWPGSVFEFLDILPRLTDPARFGGSAAISGRASPPGWPIPGRTASSAPTSTC